MNVHTRAAFFLVLACALVLAVPLFSHAQITNVEQRAALQAQLDQIEKDIANNQGSLSVLQQQRVSLERDIGILDAKIKNAQLQIKQTDIALKQLGSNITEKQSAIKTVDEKVQRGKQSLAQLLRRTREVDEISLP